MNFSDKIVRAATIENRADENGVVDIALMTEMYNEISAKTIVTGFAYVSENGRAMHPRQAGIINEQQQEAWQEVVQNVKSKKNDIKLIMQLAHTGRQTTRKNAVGASDVKCTYFKNKAKPLTKAEITQIIEDFTRAALRAQRAGFDGIQIHAAHGYLIHQFLSPYTNKRLDEYAEKDKLLIEILNEVRKACGKDLKIWIKISHGDDRGGAVTETVKTLKKIENLVDAIEVSYGTMEYPFNIIRGAHPIDKVMEINPLFTRHPRFTRKLWKKFIYPFHKKKLFKFARNYNWNEALKIKESIKKPIIVTGGIRSAKDIEAILKSGIDGVSLSRPFLCEPDLVAKMTSEWKSKCTNCNLCTINCDTKTPTHCYMKDLIDEI